MPHFQKYNLTRPSSYETFVYYDEVDVDGNVYYIQFMHAGYKDAEVMSQTFHTNLTEKEYKDYKDYKYISTIYKELYKNLCEYTQSVVNNKTLIDLPPSYILTSIMFQLKNVGKRIE